MVGIGEEALGMVYGGRRRVWKDICSAILGEAVDGSWIELHCSLFAGLQAAGDSDVKGILIGLKL